MTNKRLNLSLWHILVIDDDTPSLLLMQELWKRYKANLYLASSGIDALHQLEKICTPTVILCDLLMPEMDGYMFLSKLRQTSNFSVPVIAVTAQAGIADRERVLNSGFDGYISKPIYIRTFIQEVMGWMIMKRK